jgi:hypothetical protein
MIMIKEAIVMKGVVDITSNKTTLQKGSSVRPFITAKSLKQRNNTEV